MLSLDFNFLCTCTLKASKKVRAKKTLFFRKNIYSGRCELKFRNRYEHGYFAELAKQYDPKQNQRFVSTRWY